MTSFDLDPRLAADSHLLANGPLSQLRLMDDQRFAWLLLVPRVAGASELIDLGESAQQVLLAEVGEVSRVLRSAVPCDKLNIGALGNIVEQLHVHVLARCRGDAAWPGPVWGTAGAMRMELPARTELTRRLRSALRPEFWFQP